MSQATSKITEADRSAGMRIYRNATASLQSIMTASENEAEALAVIARMGATVIASKALPSAKEAAAVASFNKILTDALAQLRQVIGDSASQASR